MVATLRAGARKGSTSLNIVCEWPQPMSGVCELGGCRYTYQAGAPYWVQLAPVAGGVGLQTDLASGTEIRLSNL